MHWGPYDRRQGASHTVMAGVFAVWLARQEAGPAMARYNVRDLIGHWVKPRSAEGKMCPHACCRGHRVHPDNYPVILPSRLLRRASDEDLADHFHKVGDDPSPQARYAEAQILHEMERRDREQMQRRQHREAVASAQAARRMEREADAERIRLEAEEYTKGYLVTAQGRARGIVDEEILTGREDVFIRYATPEAKAYFADHPRPTAAYFRGRDTRVPYSDRPTRRRPAVPRRTRALGWAPPRTPSRPRRATRALGWGDSDERQAG
jgi:hypothetical protein